jgi:hypothetical protein
MISIMALVLVISIGFLVPKAAAQSDKYSKMAPVDQYSMEGTRRSVVQIHSPVIKRLRHILLFASSQF